MDKRRLLGTDLDVSVICYGPMRAAQDAAEPNTRLFPVDLTSRPEGIWFKLTNWQAGGAGFVDPDSKWRVRITEDFQIAPFFDHVKASEGEY